MEEDGGASCTLEDSGVISKMSSQRLVIGVYGLAFFSRGSLIPLMDGLDPVAHLAMTVTGYPYGRVLFYLAVASASWIEKGLVYHFRQDENSTQEKAARPA